MRVLVCGGRDYNDREFVFKTLDGVHAIHSVTLVIEGGATGADMLARQWAISRGIPFETERAQWKTYGKSAGSIRNGVMLNKWKPDMVVGFPGGTGTANMMRQAKAAGVPVF